MSKRNLILLIILLIILSAVVFVSFSSYEQNSTKTNTSSGTNFVSNFFPFGKSNTTTPSSGETPADVSGYVSTENTSVSSTNKLQRVSNLQIAGYGVYMKERFKTVAAVAPQAAVDTTTTTVKTKPTAPLTEFAPALRYVEKATGNIYETFADSIDERKFSVTVIPEVYEAYFGNKGEAVVMRYLKDDGKTIETFTGSLPKEILGGDVSGNNEVTGSFLPENISDLSISPDALKLFYLFNVNDGVVGITSGILGDKKSQVFSSAFTEWLSSWPNNKMITLTTKPSSDVPGYMYTVDPSAKNFKKILGNIKGLTTLTSPNGKLVLYSDNNLSLNIYNTDTRMPISTGAKTLPEKCVWNSTSTIVYCSVPKFIDSGNYPDTWYQGEVSFSDEIWKIDAASGNASLITDPSQLPGGEDIDGIKLTLDDGENYLFFMNKSDYSLWELGLK